MKVDLVIDLQFGSTGKGAICGYLGREDGYDMAISANMPNAGHTYRPDPKRKYVFKVLPSAATSRTVKNILIGPGAVFDWRRLLDEFRQLPWQQEKEIYIHECAIQLHPDHILGERTMDSIGSTKQGAGTAVMDKIRRNKETILARTIDTTPYAQIHIVKQHEWIDVLQEGSNILAEGSQGYSLGIHTPFYPYTTSRDCTPAAFLSAMQVPVSRLRRVIGSMRTYPIRVGGTSGPGYPDQQELDWEALGQTPERTTVTNKIRRVFTYSRMQIEEAVFMCEPDEIFLNFCNYATDPTMQYILMHLDTMNLLPKWYGYGPLHGDIISGPIANRSGRVG